MKNFTKYRFAGYAVWTLVLALSGIAGCGGGGAPDQIKTYPATGTLSLDGNGFGPARIVFVPEKDVPLQPSGLVDATGKITVTTYSSGDGLPAGTYKVTISGDPTMPAPAHPQLYDNSATTVLVVTITEKGPNDFKLNMDSKAGPAGSAAGSAIPAGANLPPGTDPSKAYGPVVGPGAKPPTTK